MMNFPPKCERNLGSSCCCLKRITSMGPSMAFSSCFWMLSQQKVHALALVLHACTTSWYPLYHITVVSRVKCPWALKHNWQFWPAWVLTRDQNPICIHVEAATCTCTVAPWYEVHGRLPGSGRLPGTLRTVYTCTCTCTLHVFTHEWSAATPSHWRLFPARSRRQWWSPALHLHSQSPHPHPRLKHRENQNYSALSYLGVP